MTDHPCGVEGCTSPPRWERDSPADADLHEYLCSEHWKMLHQYNWIAAAAYRPITGLPDTVASKQATND